MGVQNVDVATNFSRMGDVALNFAFLVNIFDKKTFRQPSDSPALSFENLNFFFKVLGLSLLCVEFNAAEHSNRL